MKKFYKPFLFIIFLLLFFIFFNKESLFGFVNNLRPFPSERLEPKAATMSCNYHGEKLILSQTVYGNVANYYKTNPNKKIAYYSGNNKAFVYTDIEDKTLDEITTKIKKFGEAKKLNSDQTLDLAACFMQSIPYDELKAKKILSTKSYPVSEVIPRYPYETLYDFTGICTDKSYLGAAIFSRLGYGVSLLSFDQQRHLSIGISVPEGFQELGTNYAIMELTNKGFLVGDIPLLKENVGLAENPFDFAPKISEKNTNLTKSTQELTSASKVEEISSGKVYSRISERKELRTKIESLSLQLKTQRQKVEEIQSQLLAVEKSVIEAENIYKTQRTRSAYNYYLSVYNSYSFLLKKTNTVIAEYNYLAENYNILVEKYKNY